MLFALCGTKRVHPTLQVVLLILWIMLALNAAFLLGGFILYANTSSRYVTGPMDDVEIKYSAIFCRSLHVSWVWGELGQHEESDQEPCVMASEKYSRGYLHQVSFESSDEVALKQSQNYFIVSQTLHSGTKLDALSNLTTQDIQYSYNISVEPLGGYTLGYIYYQWYDSYEQLHDSLDDIAQCTLENILGPANELKISRSISGLGARISILAFCQPPQEYVQNYLHVQQSVRKFNRVLYEPGQCQHPGKFQRSFNGNDMGIETSFVPLSEYNWAEPNLHVRLAAVQDSKSALVGDWTVLWHVRCLPRWLPTFVYPPSAVLFLIFCFSFFAALCQVKNPY